MGKRRQETRRTAVALPPVPAAGSPPLPRDGALPAPAAVANAPAAPVAGEGLLPEFLRLPAVCLALGLLALLAYCNSFNCGLVLDNRVIIEHDPRLREVTAETLKLIFTRDYWWPYLASDLYRPLTTLTYQFNYSVLGNKTNPAGYHLVNLLLHWANICLVVVILRRLTGRLALAGLAGAIFAVLPVNVESITNIVGRADLLATLAILLGGWCYIRAAEAAGAAKVLWLALMGVVATLGMFAKESAIMICAFVVLYDVFWRLPGLVEEDVWAGLKTAAVEFVLKGYLALAPGLALFFAVRDWLTFNSPVFSQIFVDNPIAFAGFFQGRMTAVKVIGHYLGLLVYPATLSCDYSYNQVPLYGTGTAWQDGQAWLALAGIAALVGTAVWGWRRWPLYAWGTMFFFGMLLPTSNLVVAIGSIKAERFLYLPSIGFCAVAAQALLWAGARGAGWLPLAAALRARLAWIPAVAVLFLFTVRTFARNADWYNDLTLWQSAVAAAPNSFKVHKGLSNALSSGEKKFDELRAALASAERGLAVLDQQQLPDERRDNTLFHDMGMLYRLAGETLEREHRALEAEEYYRKSLAILDRAIAVDKWVNGASREKRLQRGVAAEDIADVGNYRIYIQDGLGASRLGDWARMERSGRYIVRLAPYETMGYLITGAALFNTGRPREAAVQYLEVLLIDARQQDAWMHLARCYAALNVQPPPIQRKPNGDFAINDGIPLVREQMIEACVTLVRNFERARQLGEAQRLRDRALKEFRVPPEAFTAAVEALPATPAPSALPPVSGANAAP